MRRLAALGTCLAFAGCTNAVPDPPPFTTEAFGRAFQEGPWAGFDGTYEMQVVRLGNLKLPSGRIIATEPLVIRDDVVPFTVTVPPGEYPVEASIARYRNAADVAFARVVFDSSKPVAYWKLAVRADSDAGAIAAGVHFGYPVDGGTGSLMDLVAAQDVSKMRGDEGFYKVIYSGEVDLLHHIFDTGRANLAVFSTGIGDGVYSSYFGFASSGEPVMLVSDYNMFPWEPRYLDGKSRSRSEIRRRE